MESEHTLLVLLEDGIRIKEGTSKTHTTAHSRILSTVANIFPQGNRGPVHYLGISYIGMLNAGNVKFVELSPPKVYRYRYSNTSIKYRVSEGIYRLGEWGWQNPL